MSDKQETQNNEDCAQCREYLAGWKRAQADYANLKKEVEREKTEFSKYANERMLESLLPAIDQFETALMHKPDLSALAPEQKNKLEKWYEGISAVKDLWSKEFASLGLDSIQPIKGDEFDPLIHEAVGREQDTEIEDGRICRVLQAGWRLHSKLLRPARVMIASKP